MIHGKADHIDTLISKVLCYCIIFCLLVFLNFDLSEAKNKNLKKLNKTKTVKETSRQIHTHKNTHTQKYTHTTHTHTHTHTHKSDRKKCKNKKYTK